MITFFRYRGQLVLDVFGDLSSIFDRNADPLIALLKNRKLLPKEMLTWISVGIR